MLTLNLYSNHFSVQGVDLGIKLLENINYLQLPEFFNLLPNKFINGKYLVKIIDHRYNTTQILSLEATETYLLNDAGDLLPHVLPWMVEPICLDPSLSVHEAALKHYSRVKMAIPQKRKLSVIEQQSTVDEPVDFLRFQQLDFVEEWRRKKKMANDESMVGLGDKQKIKLKPTGQVQPRKSLLYNANRRIVRTIRYEQTLNSSTFTNAEKYFHILNVYQVGSSDYEAVLRWGDIDGTANNGNTLYFPIGSGKLALEYYIAHFKALYAIDHTFLVDSANESQKSAS